MATLQNDRDIKLQAAPARLAPIVVNNNVELVGQQIRDASVNTRVIVANAISTVGYNQRVDYFNITSEGVWTNVVAAEMMDADPNEKILVDVQAMCYGGTITNSEGTANTGSVTGLFRVIMENAIGFTGVTTQIISFGNVVEVDSGKRIPWMAKRLLSAPGATQLRLTIQAFRYTGQNPWAAGLTSVTGQQIKR